MMLIKFSVFGSTILIATVLSAAEPLRMLTWNLESGGSDPNVIAQQLGLLSGFDVYGLTEVDPIDSQSFVDALGPDYGYVMSATGFQNRLLTVYDQTRLEKLDQQELTSYEGVRMNSASRSHRSPMVTRFRDRHSDDEFQVMVVHLARGDARLRQDQATALRLWGEDQLLPSVAIGDFNFDYSIRLERGNAAFREFVRDDHWRWVRPDPLVDTNWSDRDGDGRDNFPDSMLDFAFVAGAARQWLADSSVIVREGDFPDDQATSDHRPVTFVAEMPTVHLAGDFDNDGILSAADVDALAAAIREGLKSPIFDLNQDTIVDFEDRDFWVHELKQTWYGDANLNGRFNSDDLLSTFSAGGYDDVVPTNSDWATGDFDGDQEFSSDDLLLALSDGGYDMGLRVAVPEPAGSAWIFCCAFTLVGSMRQRSRLARLERV